MKSIPEDEYTGGISNTERLKNKIITSAWNTLFLNVYEKQHIKNAVNVFNEDGKLFKYIIDSPQFLNKMWKEVAMECGITEGELTIVKDSENWVGLQIADIISGCINACLTNVNSNQCQQALSIFSEYFKDKMIRNKNPNLIFYNEFSNETKNYIFDNLSPEEDKGVGFF